MAALTTIFEKLRAGVTTASAAETQAIAAEFAAALPADVTLALHGNLGAGKTTFVQGLARGFGVTEPVTSPTFNLYAVHRALESANEVDRALESLGESGTRSAFPGIAGVGRTLIHLDAYRLDDPKQMEALLVEDFLISPWCLAIEWPEKIAAWVPSDALHLDLDIGPDERHRISLR